MCKIAHTVPSPAVVTSGVPQGSNLGPLLVLIYLNDLPNRLSLNASMFADDTNLGSRKRLNDNIKSIWPIQKLVE